MDLYNLVDKNIIDTDELILYINLDLKQRNILPLEYYKEQYNINELLSIVSIIMARSYFNEAFDLLKCIEYMILTSNNIYVKELILSMKALWAYSIDKFESEYSLYEPIKYYINELIPNATIENNINIVNRKIPDIFLRINNELFVGEVKKEDITNKHVLQLSMYINTYNTASGYIFGKNLSCILPNNIIFININDIQYKYKREIQNYIN